MNAMLNPKTTVYQSVFQSGRPAQHMPGIVFVIILHIAMVYALINGLVGPVIKAITPPPIMRFIVDRSKSPPEAMPLPQPKFEPILVILPISEIPIDMLPSGPTISGTREVRDQRQAQPAHIAPVIDAKHSCQLPEYPAASRRLDEQGTVTIGFLIDAKGAAVASRIEASSGFQRLDEAARAALSHCRFKPGTVDGMPEQSWAHLKYIWRLD